MVEVKGKKFFDFMGLSKVWMTISALTILSGLLYMGINFKHPMNFGIDFTGGTTISLIMENPIKDDSDRLKLTNGARAVMTEEGMVNSVIQVGNDNVLNLRIPFVNNTKKNELLKLLSERVGNYEVLEIDTIGPTIGEDLKSTSLWITAIAIFAMLVYLTFRFEFLYGVSAILALMHDLIITIGLSAILQIEVNTVFVAAILTILGYSINDTIVIFDRIRENSKLLKRETYLNIVNISINQTFSRSVNTVLTVIITIVSLLLFGGANIRDFALVLLIGISFGAYSSIFIASPILLALQPMRNR